MKSLFVFLFLVAMAGNAAAQTYCATMSGSTVTGSLVMTATNATCPAILPNQITKTQYDAFQTAINAPGYEGILNAGVTISGCTATAINGTWSVDDRSLRFLSITDQYIGGHGGKFPAGKSSINLNDKSNNGHAFGATKDLQRLFELLVDYRAAVDQVLFGGVPFTWPVASVTATKC
jgi:hypothetical protein